MAFVVQKDSQAIGRSPSSLRKPRTREVRAAWFMLSVPMLFFVAFVAVPLVATIALSLFTWDTFSPPQFVGLHNFQLIAKDPTMVGAFVTTLEFTVATNVLHLVLGLGLALAINRKAARLLNYLVQSAFFFPVIISAAAGSLIWLYMLDPNFGFVNYYLSQWGLNPPNWLANPGTALWVLVLFDVWKTLGFTVIILLSGLQAVPEVLYEVATLDGAGPWKRFWHVTIPMISPTLLFSTVTAFAGAFQVFDSMYIMTRGGPGSSTTTLSLKLYFTAFRDFTFGTASALAVVVAIVIIAVSFLQLYISRRWVNYDRV